MSFFSSENVLTTAISFLGVLISSIISSGIALIISRSAARSEINKQRASIFIDKLTAKRMECYPLLFEIISNIAKVIRNEPLDTNTDVFGKRFITTEITKINDWDNKNSIFLGSDSVRNVIKLKSAIYSLINGPLNEVHVGTTQDLRSLIDAIADLELSLKNEIGIFPLEDLLGKNQVPTYEEINRSI